MLAHVAQLETEALAALEAARGADDLRALEVQYLGRKGRLTLLLRSLSNLPPADRPAAGQRANAARQRLAQAFAEALQAAATAQDAAAAGLDVSLPGRLPGLGGSHPITQITDRICEIFGALGFDSVEGPEVETDRYNFEALNIPRDHPARDMQDTFYVSDTIVLRTHTSPIQVRTMEQRRPPLRVIAPGKVYRCDSDITHTPMFHQVEGLMVDHGVSFGDLKGILTHFVHQMFDDRTGIRFRPSFFPFTEPSAEVDIGCVMCRGRGCRVCSGTGWLEVLGSGMVHPAVFENVGYDSQAFTGFAFGMGVERIAMLKFGVDDIRKFFESDLRFLRQFPS